MSFVAEECPIAEKFWRGKKINRLEKSKHKVLSYQWIVKKNAAGCLMLGDVSEWEGTVFFLNQNILVLQ